MLSRLFIIATIATVAFAHQPGPIVLKASEWLGIDGNWSTVELLLGSDSQPVNVLVSTSLSEIWTVGPGGCLAKEPHCIAARGGIYTPSQSTIWSPLGIWQLSDAYLGYDENGEYGLGTIAKDSAVNASFSMSKALIVSINTTDCYVGQFGLGIIEGNFNNEVVDSPLTQAVEGAGWIPSYSYGFTAGASYRNAPASVILGGYDKARCGSEGTEFTLLESNDMPAPLVRAIEVVAASNQSKPRGWDSQTQSLSTWQDSFTAIIDSSTPFLWLPGPVCDEFAKALNLTYNSTFDLYTVTDEQYQSYTANDSFSFTFTLSSLDNVDDYGSPLDVSGVVNITISSQALISTLQYPYMNEAIQYGQPAVPYFSLRRAEDNSTFIIGRSFLQETYLITQYDKGVYSIQQTLFSDQMELVTIDQPDNSPYPPPATWDYGISSGAKAGIGISTVIIAVGIIASAWICLKRRREGRGSQQDSLEGNKESSSNISVHSTKTALSRILSLISRKRQQSKSPPGTGEDSQHGLSEAPDCEIYELPAPVPPAELDGMDDAESITDTAELSSETAQNLSVYEAARRKIGRQLLGPVPEYTPPSDGSMPPAEKAGAVASVPPQDMLPSPISPNSRSPGGMDSNGNSLPYSLPSPVTPRGDGSSRGGDDPSTLGQPPDAERMNRSYSNDSVSPNSPTAGSLPNSGIRFQRTPIDPSNVICLGTLPGSVNVPHRNDAQSESRDDEADPVSPATLKATFYEDSLGSNFTAEEEEEEEEEDMMARELTRIVNELQAAPNDAHGGVQQRQAHTDLAEHISVFRREANHIVQPGRPHSPGLHMPTEFIHVPQVPDKRYSWEEERS